MIEVEITPEMIENAKKRSENMGVLNNSVLKGFGNVYGFLGEEMVASRYKELNFIDDYDGDFEYNGILIDVKTRIGNVPPRPNFACGVFRYNLLQNCDWIIFCRVFKDLSRGFIVGKTTKSNLLNNSILIKKGESDPDGKPMKDDCYWMRIEDLEACK